MKIFIPLLLASSLLSAEMPEITLMDLNASHMEQMQQGNLQCMLRVEEGDELPIQFDLSGDVIGFKSIPENGEIVALRPFYVMVNKDQILFSLDKKKWLPPGAFFTGTLSSAVGTLVEAFGTISLRADVR